jgi:pimeloyl-ACP methyl ester carboxylesterase
MENRMFEQPNIRRRETSVPHTARPRSELVIALHCSGAGAGQWTKLRDALGDGYELIAPEHYGCDSAGPWPGKRAFTLADEAERTIALIDGSDRKVHLIGHSYGGGVALHVALARAGRLASLTLYEPSAFHLLRQFGPRAAAAFVEIRGVANLTGAGVVIGDYRGAAATFVDYWSGQGTWDALRPEVQNALTRWTPKAPLDFAALIDEPTPVGAYARITCPTLVVRGEHAPPPTRIIADTLPSLLQDGRLEIIDNAGHMGPLTHPAEVNPLIARHLAEAMDCRSRQAA